MDPIITYKNLLNKHGKIDAAPAKKFYAEHESDPDFARRAKVLHELFLLKQELTVSDG